MFSVVHFVDNKGLKFSSALWVSCVSLPYRMITQVLCVVLTLFSHGVSTLM